MTESPSTLARVHDLRRDYGERCAVRDLSFEVQRGETLGLLGPNGAGKSTTLRMLCGLLAPSAGRVEIGGHDLARAPLAAKRLLGYLPETPPLYPELRVDEYLHHCGRLHRMPRRALPDALDRTLQRCGLSEVRRRLIGNLSKGYRQRVGIAQALLHEPALVVLDEPTSGLDPNQVREIRLLIRELSRERAVLLSTHILPEARAICDRVLILNQGRLAFQGPVADTARPERLRVRLAVLPPEAELLEIPGVVASTPADGCGLLLQVTPDTDQAALAQALTRWGLLELSPRPEDLEETFVRLTTGEGDPPGEVEAC